LSQEPLFMTEILKSHRVTIELTFQNFVWQVPSAAN